MADGGSPVHAGAAREGALQGRRDRSRAVVLAELAALHALQPVGDISHRNRHNRQVTGQCLFHDVGRAFLHRREDQRIAGIHVQRHLIVAHPPGDGQPRRHSVVEEVDGLFGEWIAFARLVRAPDEQYQSRAWVQPQLLSRFGLRNRPKQGEVDSRRNDVHGCGGREMIGQVGGDQNDGVGVSRDEAGRALQHSSGSGVSAVTVAHDAEDVAPAERDDEGHPLRKRQESTLPELRVNEVIALGPQATPEPDPRFHVFVGILLPVKREHLHIDAGLLQKLGLPLDERGREPDAGDRPLARHHQNAQRGHEARTP